MTVYSLRTATKMAAAILAFGGPGLAFAQDAAADETATQLLACDSITDMSEKLACFDAVVKGLKTDSAVPEAAPPAAPAAESVTVPVAEPAARAAPAAESVTVPAAEPAAPAAPAAGSSGAAAPAVVAAPAAATATTIPAAAPPPATAAAGTASGEAASLPDVTPAATAATPVDPVDEFGRDSMPRDAEEEEQVVEPKEEKLTMTLHATVVRSWINNDGRFSVELDNGQVWRETEISQTRYQGDNDMVFGAPRSSTGRLPKAGRTVEISEGRMSGYRMKIEGIRQAAWVRRTK
jgi:hypothetical protein